MLWFMGSQRFGHDWTELNNWFIYEYAIVPTITDLPQSAVRNQPSLGDFYLYFVTLFIYFLLLLFFNFFNFTILYWFCHISTWICQSRFDAWYWMLGAGVLCHFNSLYFYSLPISPLSMPSYILWLELLWSPKRKLKYS